MADVAELTLKMKFSDIENAKKALQGLGMTSEQVEKKVSGMSKTATSSLGRTGLAFKNFQKQFSAFSGSLSTFANQINMYITLPLIGVGAAAIKMSNELNRGMANVGTLIPQETANLVEYKEEVQRLSVAYGKTFDDLTRGLYEVISAFPGTREAIEITELAAKTSRAGLSTTKQALDLLSATTKAYGDTSAEAQKKVANLAFTAVKYGQTTFLDLSQAIQRVTSQSVALGISQEELFTTFSAFTGVTGNAEEVATQLRSALISLLNPTKELEQLLTNLNVTSGKQLIEQKGLMGSFKALRKEAEDLYGDNVQKYIRRIEGIIFVTQLTTKLQDKYNDVLERTGDISGAVQEAFEAQTTGMYEAGFTMEQATQAIKVALSDLGDAMAPLIIEVSGYIQDLAKRFSELDDEGVESLLNTGKALVKFGVATKVLSTLLTTLSSLLNVITKLGASKLLKWLLLLNPTLTGVAAGALGVNIAYKKMYENGQKLTELRLAEEFKYVSDEVKAAEGKLNDFNRTAEIIEGSFVRFEEMSSKGLIKVTALERAEHLAESLGIGKDAVLEIASSSSQLSLQLRSILRQEGFILEHQIASRKQEIDDLLESMEDVNDFTTSLDNLRSMDNEQAPEKNLRRKDVEEKVAALQMLRDENFLEGGEEEFWTRVNKVRRDALQSLQQLSVDGKELTADQKELMEDLLGFLEIGNAELAKFQEGGKSLTEQWTEALKTFNTQMEVLDNELASNIINDAEYAQQELQALQTLVGKGFELGKDSDFLQEWIDRILELKVETEEPFKITFELQQEIDKDLFELQEGIPNLFTNYGKTNEFRIGQTQEDLNRLTEKYRELREEKAKASDDGVVFDTSELEVTEEELKKVIKELRELESIDVFQDLGVDILSTAFDHLASNIRNVAHEFAFARDAIDSNISANEALAGSMAELGAEIIRMLPQLFIQAGLQMLGTDVALGLSLIGMGLAGEIGIGLYEGSQAAEEANSGVSANAKGNVFGFAGGGAFTNSIVDTPTLFPFAQGTGLMGEAGPEAIMPLSRTSSGDLGVQAIGSSEQEVNINIINNNNSEVTTKERQTDNGREIDVLISKKVVRTIANGEADGVMSSRYGISRRGVR